MSEILNKVFGSGELLEGEELEAALERDYVTRVSETTTFRPYSTTPEHHHGRTSTDLASSNPAAEDDSSDAGFCDIAPGEW